MGINKERKKIILKGYANITDVKKFMGCGYVKAKMIYDTIQNEIEESGKKKNPLGVHPKYLLKLLEMTKDQIFKYAELEEY